MDIYQILEDIRSDRLKKVIVDSDTANEMDDQYAIAYAVALDNFSKFQLLSINAAPFGNSEDFVDNSKKSYDEIIRVLKEIGKFGNYPVFEGPSNSITAEKGPVNCPAARNIIETALGSDEIIYILALGACTNIASAIMLEPEIKDKICVIWLAGHTFSYGHAREYNVNQDFKAGQYLFDSGVAILQMPAFGGGTEVLKVSFKKLESMLNKDTAACKFFGRTLPGEFKAPIDPAAANFAENYENWQRVLWDIAAPGVLSRADAFDLSIVSTPGIADNGEYIIDETRHKEIYMNSVNPDIIIDDALSYIANL